MSKKLKIFENLENLKNFQSKKIIILFFALQFLLIGVVSADTTSECRLNITMINQDPYPAIPGEYVKIVFQANGVQDPNCDEVKFELIPSYPFSLDTNKESLQILEQSTWTPDYMGGWMVPYTLRVDKDALDGDSEVKVRYSIGNSNSYIQKVFTITVEDLRTNFDAVIQESTSSEVSIAIANTGKYTANAVVVRIPEQENFMATETNGQMVGNLDAGDYTIVSFSISPKRTSAKTSNELKFDIYYTDSLGERRIVNMELALNMEGNSSSMPDMEIFSTRMQRQNSFSWSGWYTFAIASILIFTGIILFRKFKKRKTSREHAKTPDWVKNAKEKEKSK